METKTMSFRDTIILAMSEEMRRDENVFLMGEDVGVFGGDFGTSVGMLEEFGPERVRDCPISEAAISGAAAGAAMTGLRPIVDMTFMDFSVIAMDAIVNQAAKTRYMFGGKGQVPMTVRCAAGNGVGSAAQHSQSLESWFTILDVDIDVECSSGTYVRAIARDMGKILGVGGHLTALRRTRIGDYDLSVAVELGDFPPAMMSMADAAKRSFPCVTVDVRMAMDVGYGRRLDMAVPADVSGILSPTGELLALYRPDGSGARPVAVLV